VTPEELRREMRHAAANLLTALTGTLDLLAARATPDTPEATRLARARGAADGLSALLTAYLGMPTESSTEDHDAATLCAGLLPLLDAVSNCRAAWRIAAAPALPRVRVERPGFDLALLGAARDAAAAAERGAALTVALAPDAGGVRLTAGTLALLLPAAQP
jgi:hypothetical protein